MNRNPLVGFLYFVLLLSAVAVADEAYANGHWYDGSGFVERTVYVSDGRISFRLPEQIDNTQLQRASMKLPICRALMSWKSFAAKMPLSPPKTTLLSLRAAPR